jgi:hypothetical protein
MATAKHTITIPKTFAAGAECKHNNVTNTDNNLHSEHFKPSLSVQKYSNTKDIRWGRGKLILLFYFSYCYFISGNSFQIPLILAGISIIVWQVSLFIVHHVIGQLWFCFNIYLTSLHHSLLSGSNDLLSVTQFFTHTQRHMAFLYHVQFPRTWYHHLSKATGHISDNHSSIPTQYQKLFLPETRSRTHTITNPIGKRGTGLTHLIKTQLFRNLCNWDAMAPKWAAVPYTKKICKKVKLRPWVEPCHRDVCGNGGRAAYRLYRDTTQS